MTDTQQWTGGAIGAGLVLIVLPCAALYFGMASMDSTPGIGLPIWRSSAS